MNILNPRFFYDWARIGAGNFATYHLILADEVDRGQNINIRPASCAGGCSFQWSTHPVAGQRLTDVPEGSSISFVDGHLVNIAAEGETANNQIRMMVVEQCWWTDGCNPSRTTRKGGDFYYYGGDSLPIGPHEVTIAIEGELSAGRREPRRSGDGHGSHSRCSAVGSTGTA